MSQFLNRQATQSVSERIVEAVADAKDVSSLELDPLYDVVDPDALDGFFQGGAAGLIVFIFVGWVVVVPGAGDVADPAPGR
jgi:hypothetical protein